MFYSSHAVCLGTCSILHIAQLLLRMPYLLLLTHSNDRIKITTKQLFHRKLEISYSLKTNCFQTTPPLMKHQFPRKNPSQTGNSHPSSGTTRKSDPDAILFARTVDIPSAALSNRITAERSQ